MVLNEALHVFGHGGVVMNGVMRRIAMIAKILGEIRQSDNGVDSKCLWKVQKIRTIA